MSAFSDALLASVKADEKPAAEMVENLVMALITDIPMLLPTQYASIAQGLDAFLAPQVKAYLDAQITKLP